MKLFLITLICSSLYAQSRYSSPIHVGPGRCGFGVGRVSSELLHPTVQDVSPLELRVYCRRGLPCFMNEHGCQKLVERSKRGRELRTQIVCDRQRVQSAANESAEEELLNLAEEIPGSELLSEAASLDIAAFMGSSDVTTIDKPSNCQAWQVPVTCFVSEGAPAGSDGVMVCTEAMQVDPLSSDRMLDWYEGPRESRNVVPLQWKLHGPNAENMNYSCALEYALSQSHADWRLPTIWELEALYQQRARLEGDINHNHYWSSTPVADDQNLHWVIDFEFSNVRVYHKSFPALVRLCRLPPVEPDEQNSILQVFESLSGLRTSRSCTELSNTSRLWPTNSPAAN